MIAETPVVTMTESELTEPCAPMESSESEDVSEVILVDPKLMNGIEYAVTEIDENRVSSFSPPHSPERMMNASMSPNRPGSKRSLLREVSPSACYSHTTEKELEPISPKSATQRSLGMDDATYNLFVYAVPSLVSSPTRTGTQQQNALSCPYCKMGALDHCCSNKLGIRHVITNEVREEENTDLSASTSVPVSTLSKVSAGGVEYLPVEILAEGWLQKKGTGHDWLGSRAWKARWARLCMARVVNEKEENCRFAISPDDTEGFQGLTVLTPLLLLYWFPASPQVSTAIVLDSTVVLAVDLEDKQKCNPYRFEVRHATSQVNATLPTQTRTFGAPQKVRDAWVYAISQALLEHAKAKGRARKLQQDFQQQHQFQRRWSPDRRSGSFRGQVLFQENKMTINTSLPPRNAAAQSAIQAQLPRPLSQHRRMGSV